MAEVLDAPPFTDPNKAREAGLRSAEVARQKAQELENLRILLASKPIDPKPEPVPVQHEVQRQIDLTNELIAHARDRINDKDYRYCEHCERSGISDKDKAALIRELRGLMEHLCRLHNIAQAPTSKVTARPQKRPEALPAPVPCGPEPTISSVPQSQPTPSTPQDSPKQ